MLNHLVNVWHQHFGTVSPEVIVRAPGRVNIIGEHTDYNEGWVLPGAMSRSVFILLSKNITNSHHWIALNLNDEYFSDRSTLMPLWAKYIDGTIQLYFPQCEGLNILVGGDLPVGSGVSSSSSLVCGLLYALQIIKGENESREALALIGSRVEREIIGLQGGIMDQFAIMLSKEHHLMMLDCRSTDYTFITAELPGCIWILINTKVKHKLVDSDYNNRAEDCKKGVALIQKKYPDVKSLRDVTPEMISDAMLPELLKKRCLFVLEENVRVLKMVDALNHHDPVKAGQLLNKSHKGLSQEYEVSCDELDHLASFANGYDGVYGARMMGGGFGGCVICLVSEDISGRFLKECNDAYLAKFGFEPEVIHFHLANGVEQVLPE
ncbi:MAG: galactokinase [Saprospiraceae bacterium]